MNIKKSLIWFWLLTKRLLFKVSFVILICLIPLLVYIANISLQGDSGVLKIILCSDEGNSGAEDVMECILQKSSIMLFEKSYDRADALRSLEQKKADAVWYFDSDLDNRINLYASGKSSKPFVTVYEREDTIPLKLSREKLFGAVFSKFSYFLYRDFAYSQIVSPNKVSEQGLKSYYDNEDLRGDLVEIKSISSDAPPQTQNYLSSPLRGMLSVLVMLCGFAGAMYFVKDRRDGRFDWMKPTKQIMPAFAQCLSAVTLSAFSALAAIFLSGIGLGAGREILCMVMFILACVGFCLCFSVCFSSSGALGAVIPAFIIVMMVLSPIFFNIQALKPLRLMLPTHYYLYSVHDASYIPGFALYIVCVYALSLFLNSIFNKIFAYHSKL